MSTKHTPGPWTVSDEKDDDGFTVTVLYGQRQWVHAIGQPWVHEKIATLECEGTAPDARLIAAAPDLLAALERLYAWVDNNVAYGLPDKERAGIDATLAKAKGRE
jgi:hypothetical protein